MAVRATNSVYAIMVLGTQTDSKGLDQHFLPWPDEVLFVNVNNGLIRESCMDFQAFAFAIHEHN